MKNTITSKQACTIAHQIRRETGCSLAEAFKAAYAGNNTVNTKTSWTAEELNQIFSDKTAELLRKGYTIDLAGMAGHQGEIGKVVFKKNNNYYILVMESKICSNEGKYNEHYTIRFGKYTEEVKVRALDTWTTLWVKKFDTTWSLEFVKITDNYFVTVKEAEAINKKWLNRMHNNSRVKPMIVDSKYYRYVLPALRAQKGCKSLRMSSIVEVRRINTFAWASNEITGRYYRITLDKTDKAGRPVVIEIRFNSNKK